MKKVFRIKTKNNAVIGSYEYNVFAKDLKEAIKKVEKVLEKDYYVNEAEILCNVEEDKDLEEYKEGGE